MGPLPYRGAAFLFDMKKNTKTQKTTRGGLTTNSGKTAPSLVANQFAHFAHNVSSSLVRNDEMEGKKYVVVPMVMMTAGVHNGSNGPLYYPADELSKTPEVWNMKPVIVYHQSTKSGKGAGACHPDVVTKHKIGVIMNTQWDEKKNRLIAEAWLEPERVKEVDVRVANAIAKKEMLELSTGLFTDNEQNEGEFNGEHYVAIARNYRPDHLAVLPDQIGACSIDDGAGFIRNELNSLFPKLDREDVEELRQHVITSLASSKVPAVKMLITNEASHEQVREMLYMVLAKKYPADKGYCCPWIEAVYDDSFIYSMGGKLFKLNYAKTDSSVKLEGEPSEVVRVTEYRTVTVGPVGNASTSNPTKPNKGTTMNKDQLVAALITNHGYKQEDREWLMGLDETALAKMRDAAVTANASKTVAPATAPAQAPAAAAPAATAPKTENAAPQLSDADRAALEYGKTQLAKNKATLVSTITANKANKFSAEQLNAMDIATLEGLAALAQNSTPAPAPAPQADFGGLGHVAAPISNQVSEADALVSPGMDFGKK